MKIIWCGSWDMEYDRQNFISGHFLSFYPFSKLRNQNLKIWKRRLEISSFYTWVTQTTIIWCGSWDMKRNGHNFLSFWTTFYPFTPLNTWKIKILKTWKSPRRYYHFTHAYHKWQSYDVCFLRLEHDRFFVILGYFLPCYPLTTQKIKTKKKGK